MSTTQSGSAQPTSFIHRPFGRWSTSDIIAAAMIGVTFGVVYWGWSAAYTALETPLKSFLGPSIGLLGGPWLIAGVIGGFVVRRPGAAVLAEVLAATVSALIGNQWGWTTILSGVLQGLGVEIALAIFLFRKFTPIVAILGGILAAGLEFIYEAFAYWQGTTTGFKIGYLLFFALSGAVVAGLGGWALTRQLAATGAIDSSPAGRERARDHAV